MATATEIRATAMALTRSMSTPDLVKAMALSDTLMAGFEKDVDTGAPLDTDGFLHLTTARGFMIDVLDERDALHLVMA